MSVKSDFVKWSKEQLDKKKELLAFIDDGMLTPDEAAASMAGWELKNPNPSDTPVNPLGGPRKQMTSEEIYRNYLAEFHAHTGTLTTDMLA